MTKQHAIYMRVSTQRQDTASQEPELRRWAESHEGDSCWYRDTYTVTSMDRPGFRQMMKDIEAGRVVTLVVWRLDRLGRTAQGLTALFEHLIRCKVNLITLKDGLDLVTPAGRLMANILAGVAAYETEVRAERHPGGPVGRPRPRRPPGRLGSRPADQGDGGAGRGDPAAEVGGRGDRGDRAGHRAVPPDDLPHPGRGVSGLISAQRRRAGQGHSLRHEADVSCELELAAVTLPRRGSRDEAAASPAHGSRNAGGSRLCGTCPERNRVDA